MDWENITAIILGLVIFIFPFLCALIPSWIGNRDAFDFNYTFNKAIVWDGKEKMELDIESWKDYEGEQIQIKTSDGKVYLVSSMNTILIGE